MEKKQLLFSDTYILKTPTFSDKRGDFLKTFSEQDFEELGLSFSIKEIFYSISSKNVFRGMHFQLPPNEQNKLVFCTRGKAMDYLIDLRTSSPTFRKVQKFELSENSGNIVYIPAGVAHGFLSLCDDTMLVYAVSTNFKADLDYGISFDSLSLEIPVENIIVSDRDRSFPSLDKYASPF